MNTLTILGLLAPIGAIDVLYYHWYRFRLYEQPSSVAEELTHLARGGAFLALVVVLSRGVADPATDAVVLGLLAFDFLNSALDVALEPRSRAPLGGLPGGEYFLHFLGLFGAGFVVAHYLSARVALPIPAASGWGEVQANLLIVGGAGLLLVELGLFLRARLRARRSLPHEPLAQAGGSAPRTR